MATFTERLELLITGHSTDAVAALNKTANASEQLTTKQKLMSTATGAANTAFGELGLSAEAGGAALASAGIAAGAIAGVKLAQWAKGAADEWAGLAGEIRTFQRASGASAEDASRWVAVLDDMEVSTETGAKAVFKLSREIGQGGEKLAQFGVEVAKNKDGTTDLTGTLLNVADAYTAMKDPADRAALVQAAFGKAGAELIPVLEQGRKGLKDFFEGAEEGHQILSQDEIAKAREYELALDDLSDTMRGLKLEVGAAVAPIITDFANGLSEGVELLDDIGNAAGSASASLGPLGGTVLDMAGTFGDAALDAVPFFGGLKSAGEGLLSIFGDGGEAAEDFGDKTKSLSEAQQTLLNLELQGKQGTKEYADAKRDAATATAAIETATRGATSALTDHATALFAASQGHLVAAAAAIDYQAKLLAIGDAQTKYNDLLAAGAGPTQTAEQYQNDLAQANLAVQAAVLGAVDAAGKKAQADNEGASSAKIHQAALDAQNGAIIALWNSTPQTTQALKDLGYTVVTMPDGKQIVVTAETAEADRKLDTTKRKLDDLGDVILFDPGFGSVGKQPSSSRSVTPAPPPGAVVAPTAALMRGAPTAATLEDGTPVPVVSAMPRAAGGQFLTFNINVTTRGLGADAPEIQRAVVDAVRGYVARNGRLEDVTR